MCFRVFIVSICLVVLLPIAGIAQQNVTSGSLSGRIADSNGAVVGGANITATNIETSQPVPITKAAIASLTCA